MTDKTNLIREIHEYVTAHGGENTATHLLVQAASAIQTQAAELEAVGAGGVQALSAAPVAFLKSVIALCSHRGYSPANIEVWDKDDKWIADLWRKAESMLTTSPTPPAEDPIGELVVTKTKDGQIVAVTRQDDEGRILSVIATSDPEEQQASPKAAPGEPSYTSMKVAEMVLSDCGVSTDFTQLLDRVAGRIDSLVEQRLDALKACLEAAPQPAPDCHHRPPCDECAAIATQGGK